MKNASWGGSRGADRGRMSARGKAGGFATGLTYCMHCIFYGASTRDHVSYGKKERTAKRVTAWAGGQRGSNNTKKAGRGRDCHPFDRGDIEKSRKGNVAKIMES